MKATSPGISPRFRFRVGRPLLLALLAWLLFTVVRSLVLLAHGRQIGRQSAGFKRDYWLGDATSPQCVYLVLGDSTAAGWGAGKFTATYPYLLAQSVARNGYRVHVINVAVGGATLEDVRREQLPFLESLHPDLVTLTVGANDATHFTSEDAFARELDAVITALKASSACVMLMANTPEMYLAPALPLPLSIATNRRARRFNARLATALRGSRIREVNLYDEGKLDYNRNPSLYASDLFHPSAEGYRVWAQLFIRKIDIDSIFQRDSK